MNSPHYLPAGLLVRYRCRQVMLDGGPGAEPTGRLAAWLVSNERSELRPELRLLSAARGLRPSIIQAPRKLSDSRWGRPARDLEPTLRLPPTGADGWVRDRRNGRNAQ